MLVAVNSLLDVKLDTVKNELATSWKLEMDELLLLFFSLSQAARADKSRLREISFFMESPFLVNLPLRSINFRSICL